MEETKKSSGLDEKALGNQPGNDPSPTFGTTDIKTPKGQEAAGQPHFQACSLEALVVLARLSLNVETIAQFSMDYC